MELVPIALSVVAVLVAWRVLLLIAVAAPIAFSVGWFLGPVVGFSLLFLGVAFGLMWEARASDGEPPLKYIPSPPISWPVKFLGLAFIGALLGGFASEAAGSVLGGALALIAAQVFVAGGISVLTKQPVKHSSSMFEAISLLAGLGAIFGIGLAHA